MNSSTSAFGRSTHRRKNSRKANPNHVLGGAAVACLLLGCAWTVHTNILAASVYPQLGNAGFDLPVVKQPRAERTAASIINSTFALLPEPAPVIAAAESVPSTALFSFEDRFAAAAPQSEAPKLADASPRVETLKVADASPRVETPKVAEAPRRIDTPKAAEAAKPKDNPPPARTQVASIAPVAATPEVKRGAGDVISDMAQRAKAAVMSIASADRSSMVEKLWGSAPSHGSLMSYASADASVTGSIGPIQQNPALGGSAPYDRSTAVYDISAHTVYLPDGTKLEAHSGLGSKLDDPRSASIRMHGVTPPHIYELTLRESLFHGVQALRLNPIGGEDAIYGRAGLLAHTFMLGPNGDSNGCVSFRDYNAFLSAYRNQGIKRLAVVARID
jgi:hypothetical protein